MTSTHNEIIIESVKATPPAAVVSLSLFGVQLNDAMILITIVYTTFQLYFLIRDKWWIPRKARKS
jgi:hypothetical protein